ncbi:MAG: hypothetical protein A2Y16_05300 [Tenericutes bacterium GWF2_57_13]|nr:MAG: hypothetical protein A2Y16_05300 [Tenericutes bacterium GWF2_57_13]
MSEGNIQITSLTQNVVIHDMFWEIQRMVTREIRFRISTDCNSAIGRVLYDESPDYYMIEFHYMDPPDDVIAHELQHILNWYCGEHADIIKVFYDSIASLYANDFSNFIEHKRIHEKLLRLGIVNDDLEWIETIDVITKDSSIQDHQLEIDVLVFCNLINVSPHMVRKYEDIVQKKAPVTWLTAKKIMSHHSSVIASPMAISSEVVKLMKILRNIMQYDFLYPDVDGMMKFSFKFYQPIIFFSERKLRACNVINTQSSTDSGRLCLFLRRTGFSIEMFNKPDETAYKQLRTDLEEMTVEHFLITQQILFFLIE